MAREVVSAEIHFAQRLASNEKKTRDRAVKRLRKWLEIKSSSAKGGLAEDEFLKIWKGLHYCMWMSDKPLIQEELASSISNLIHSLAGNKSQVFSFIRTFFQTEAREWHGIDRWRMDKFMMLIRRFFHESLVYLKNCGWEEESVSGLMDIVCTQGMDVSGDSQVPEGLKYHFLDIYLDELSKVGAAQLKEEQTLNFLYPICSLLPVVKSQTLLRYVISHLFNVLIDEEIERIRSVPSEKAQEETPRLQVKLSAVATKLFEVAGAKTCISRNRPLIYKLVTRLEDVSKGILPQEDIEDVLDDDEGIDDRDVNSAVKRLQKLNERLLDQSGMSERKRKKREQQRAAILEEVEKLKKRKINDAEDSRRVLVTQTRLTETENNQYHKSETNLKKRKQPITSGSKHKKVKMVMDEVSEVCDTTVPGKPKKEKGTVEIVECETDKHQPVNGDLNLKAKKRKQNRDKIPDPNNTALLNTSENQHLEEEIEIWIPNKKYKGKLDRPVENVVDDPSVKRKEQSKSGKMVKSTFARFQTGIKTPPAFVRKAVTKLRTPKSEPPKRTKKTVNPDRETLSAVKKKVSFDMKRNTSLDFDDSVNFSPRLPFNPKTKPDQSILKSPDVGTNSLKKHSVGIKAAKKLKRARASDFF